MSNILQVIAGGLMGILGLLGTHPAFAGPISTYYWILNGNVLQPASSSWTLSIPGTGTSTFATSILIDQNGGNILRPNSPFGVFGSSTASFQETFQNTAPTATSSTDVIVENDKATNLSYYGDLGINSSGNTDISYTGFSANAVYLYSNDSELDFASATSTTNSIIKFFTGGTLTANERLRITQIGSVGIATTTPTNTLGVNGYIDVDGNAGGYKFSGNKFIYASTTNFATVMGIGAGVGLDATSTVFGDTAIGYQALGTTPTNGALPGTNTAIGYQTLKARTTGTTNTAVGYQSLTLLNTGTSNTALGGNTLANITNGANETALGYNSMGNFTSGNGNTAVGQNALLGAASASGALNVAMGQFALTAISTGGSNVAIGRNSGAVLTTGSNNIFLGKDSASTTVSGSNNIALGYDIALPVISGSNQLNIGNLIFGTGLTSEGPNVSTGKIGNATSTPWGLLSVSGASAGTNNGVCFVAKATGATTNFVYWYFTSAGTQVTTTTSCQGAGTTTVSYD